MRLLPILASLLPLRLVFFLDQSYYNAQDNSRLEAENVGIILQNSLTTDPTSEKASSFQKQYDGSNTDSEEIQKSVKDTELIDFDVLMNHFFASLWTNTLDSRLMEKLKKNSYWK